MQFSFVPVSDGPAWELADGVLAQCAGEKKLEFRQLPSRLRNIPEATWTVDVAFHVVDFTIDSSQDLLVFIQATRSKECVLLLPNNFLIRLTNALQMPSQASLHE